jgi:hypothetical protein
MTGHETANETAAVVGNALGHVAAVIIGFVLMIAGLGMGVSVVLLPIGVPLGFVGLGIFIWGLFAQARRSTWTGGQQ